MERAGAFAFMLAAMVPLAAVLVAGDACDLLPSMSSNDACLKASSSTPALIKPCQDMMSSAPPTAQLAFYVLTAARQAKLKYGGTIDQLNQMLGAGNLPKDLRLHVDQCKEDYVAAHGLFADIDNQLAGCDLTKARQEYLDAQGYLLACKEALSSHQSLQIYSIVSADYDMAMVAYELGALVVGK